MARSPVFKVTLSIGLGTITKDISDMVTTLTYKRSVKHDDIVDITIDNGDDIDELLEHPACIGGATVTFSYGFIGEKMSDPVSLILGDIENEYGGGDSLTLRSVDIGKSLSNFKSNTVWKKVDFPTIARKIAEFHGVTLRLDDVVYDKEGQAKKLNKNNGQASSSISAEDGTIGDFKNDNQSTVVAPRATFWPSYDSIPQAWMSNKDFLKMHLKLQRNGYIMFMKGNVMNIVIKGYDANSSETITRGTYPTLKKLKFKYREVHSDGSQVVANNAIFDPSTSQRIVELGDYFFIGANGQAWVKVGGGNFRPAQNFDYENAITQKFSSMNPIFKNSKTLPDNLIKIETEQLKKHVIGMATFYPDSQLPDEIAGMAESAVEDLSKKILTMTIVEDGNVDRDINSVVTIANVASRYLGNWYITTVTDNISAEGYITTSECEKSSGRYGVIPTEGANNSIGEGTERKKSINANTKEVNTEDVPNNTNTLTPANTDGNISISTRDQ